jgi:hypothetical protein
VAAADSISQPAADGYILPAGEGLGRGGTCGLEPLRCPFRSSWLSFRWLARSAGESGLRRGHPPGEQPCWCLARDAATVRGQCLGDPPPAPHKARATCGPFPPRISPSGAARSPCGSSRASSLRPGHARLQSSAAVRAKRAAAEWRRLCPPPPPPA